MTHLKWISDKDLQSAVQTLLNSAVSAKKNVQAKFAKNVVDPFSALFEMIGFDIDYPTWVKSEEARQAQKTLQNFIGEFHQNILGSCSGWIDMGKGNIIDLVNHNHKIIAEVKNKHNTISGGLLADLYNSLDSAVMDKTSIYKGYTAYYVTIIPSKPLRFDKTFTPSNKKQGTKCAQNQLIRTIDGASFYELVTGDKNALNDLYTVLPKLLAVLTGRSSISVPQLQTLFKNAYG